jgi:hypothetical protein
VASLASLPVDDDDYTPCAAAAVAVYTAYSPNDCALRMNANIAAAERVPVEHEPHERTKRVVVTAL